MARPDQLCIYCGRALAATVDHVPPRLLLAPPYPPNLITVPACKPCNQSFKADDEYTRFITNIDLRSAKHPDVVAKMPALIRSFQRPEAQRFRTSLLSRMVESTILGPDEKPLGHQIHVDQNRANATGARIVRGLTFAETGVPLRPNTTIKVAAKPGIVPSDPAILQFARLYTGCPDRRTRDVGQAFGYCALFYPHFSAWFLFLYGHFTWLATIDNKMGCGTSAAA